PARRPAGEGDLGIHQFRRAGAAAGGVRDAAAVWPGESGGARADARVAAQADAGLAGAREDRLHPRRRLDRAAPRPATRGLDAVAGIVKDSRAETARRNLARRT